MSICCDVDWISHRHGGANASRRSHLPWVGAAYPQGGVVVIAINPNIAEGDRTYLLSEHEISWDRHHPVLESGRITDQDSRFAYRMLRSAAAILDMRARQPIRDRDRPQNLVDVLHRTARLQVVKCVPRRESSSPTSAMGRACPAFLLEEELETLKPSLVLALGAVPDAAIAQLPRYTYLEHESSEFLWRHRLENHWGLTEVFSIPHPANRAGDWERGHDALLAALRERPV